MSRSAFSDVKLSLNGDALDQRLVAPSQATEANDRSPHSPIRPPANTHVSSHWDSRARALAHSHPPTHQDSGARPHEEAQTRERALGREYVTAAGRTGAPPASQIRSSDRRTNRPVERYSHDLFKDQVRWINRLKLDVEELEGIRLTGNAIVQLALDLLREDFNRHSSESALMRVLVRGLDWREVEPNRAMPEEEGTS